MQRFFGGPLFRSSRFWVCLFATFATLASAAPVACVPPAPLTIATVSATYSPSGFGGVTLDCGPVTFSDWQIVDASGGTTTGLPLSLVSPSTWDPATGIVSLTFNPAFVQFNAFQDVHLYFTVTSSRQVSAIDLGVGGTTSAITERACRDGIVAGSGICVGGLDGQLAAISNGSGMMNVVGEFPEPVTKFYIYKDIGKGPGGELTSFTQSFTTVPEPASMLMIGAGLLALAFTSRRRGK
jgi:hypothetical protein